MKRLGLVILVLASCAADDGSRSKEPRLPGFNPPDPRDNGIQFVIPAIHGIPAGADTLQCTYLEYRADRDLDVYDYQAFQTAIGSHHAILYAVANSQDANTHECDESDMINARYLAGGGADSPSADLPEGIVLRLPAKTQLMIQTHWINSTDGAIDGQAGFNLYVEGPKATNQVSQLFTLTTTNMSLPQGVAHAHTSCVIAQDNMNFFLIGGHEHEWGTHISLTVTPAGSASTMVYDTPWSKEYQFNPPRNSYTKDAPFTLKTGDKLDIECTYNNNTGATIEFPTEMCVVWGYFFPAVNEIDCVDGEWPK